MSDHQDAPFVPPATPRSFCVLLTLSATGEHEVDELAELLETLVQDNERWIEALLAQGIKPPCCSACGGVLYRLPTEADYQEGAILLKCAADMFADGVAACGTIAAYDAAAARVLEGGDAWVELLDGGGGASSYHAVVGTPGGTHDPTETMDEG
jgi:hypothetical protein